jgi:uncharacterized cofD-like protein
LESQQKSHGDSKSHRPTLSSTSAGFSALTSQHFKNGPKIVAIGGGNGLNALLSGLKNYTDNLTAIITVADDGGSSGKLRRDLGVLPPGDFRNCIAALADDEALTTQLFQYRFRNSSGLEGHSFGNLFITAMAEVTGSFEKAIAESSRVLSIRGQILPSTLENVTLTADLVAGDHGESLQIKGESAIPKARLPIERVYLLPEKVKAYPPALRAILEADLVILGPGSLFTSILPNLLVAEIAEAINVVSAPVFYICNVATQPGETDHFDVDRHVKAIENHVGRSFIHYVLANNQTAVKIPAGAEFSLIEPVENNEATYKLITADVIDEAVPWRHQPLKLTKAIVEWYQQVFGPSAQASKEPI